jgi:hypothetical protein
MSDDDQASRGPPSQSFQSLICTTILLPYIIIALLHSRARVSLHVCARPYGTFIHHANYAKLLGNKALSAAALKALPPDADTIIHRYGFKSCAIVGNAVGLGFRIHRVQGTGYRVQGTGHRVQSAHTGYHLGHRVYRKCSYRVQSALQGTVLSRAQSLLIRKLVTLAGPVPQQSAGSPGLRISGSPGLRVSGSPDLQISGSPDLRVSGSPGLRVSRSPGL